MPRAISTSKRRRVLPRHDFIDEHDDGTSVERLLRLSKEVLKLKCDTERLVSSGTKLQLATRLSEKYLAVPASSSKLPLRRAVKPTLKTVAKRSRRVNKISLPSQRGRDVSSLDSSDLSDGGRGAGRSAADASSELTDSDVDMAVRRPGVSGSRVVDNAAKPLKMCDFSMPARTSGAGPSKSAGLSQSSVGVGQVFDTAPRCRKRTSGVVGRSSDPFLPLGVHQQDSSQEEEEAPPRSRRRSSRAVVRSRDFFLPVEVDQPGCSSQEEGATPWSRLRPPGVAGRSNNFLSGGSHRQDPQAALASSQLPAVSDGVRKKIRKGKYVDFNVIFGQLEGVQVKKTFGISFLPSPYSIFY